MKFFYFLLLISALCAGCCTTVVRDAPQAVLMGGNLLETAAFVEALLAQKGTSVQAVNGTWREHSFQAQCVMKGDGNALTVIFLAPQMRLVTITVTAPHLIRYERAPRIPSAFEPEYVLVDLAFVELDAAAIRRAAGGALRVDDDGVTRRISMPSGLLVAEVVRRSDGTRVFRNLLHGYEYELKKLQ